MINHARSLLIGKSSKEMSNLNQEINQIVSNVDIYNSEGLLAALESVVNNGNITFSVAEDISLESSNVKVNKYTLWKKQDSNSIMSFNSGKLLFAQPDVELSYTPLKSAIVDENPSITALWSILFENSTDPYFWSYRAMQLLTILEHTDLREIITTYDSRITYDISTMFTPDRSVDVFYSSNIDSVTKTSDEVINRYDFKFKVLKNESTALLIDKHLNTITTYSSVEGELPLPNALGTFTLGEKTSFQDDSIVIANRPTLFAKTLVDKCESTLMTLPQITGVGNQISKIWSFYRNNLSSIKKLAAITALIIYYRNIYVQSLGYK